MKLVIFDMDGLMFDTERVYYKAWQQAAKEYGYEISWDIYVQIVARNSRYIEKVLKELLGEALPYEEIVLRKRQLSDELIKEEGLVLKKGLYELLQALEDLHIKKAVATSSQGEKAHRYLKLGKIEERFDMIICGDEVVESKPNPEIFLKVTERLGIAPEETIVLEDSRLGLKAARAGGMMPILIPDLVQADEEMSQDAALILEDLIQVIEVIKGEL